MSALDILADWYATTPERILTVRNGHPETDARQVWCWYAHRWQGAELAALAETLGFSPSTVGYGVRRVDRLLARDPEMRRLCLRLVSVLGVAA